jgi:outer membrane protein assembly factor BamB
MRQRLTWAGGVFLGLGLFLCGEAHAVITATLPLSKLLKEHDFIFAVKVEVLYPEKPGVVLVVDEQFKGKVPFQKLAINLTGDSEAKKDEHTPKLLKRLAPKLPLVLFANQRGKRYTVFAYTNGTWFQVIGQKAEGDTVRWAFTHCEPYLRRTFKGTTEEMRKIVVDGLAGKAKPPEPNEKEPPGLGPEVKPASGGRKSPEASFPPLRGHGPLFAVIPTLGVGGPLAVLALLFPGLFGGALLVLRNWMALLTVASINSTLLVVYLWFGRSLEDTWLGSPIGLWFTMMVVTLLGTLWAWRRHHSVAPLASPLPTPPGKEALANSASPPAASNLHTLPNRPTRSEQIILWVCSLAFLIACPFVLSGTLDMNDPGWKLLVVFTVAFGVGTLYLVYQRFVGARQAPARPALPTEGVILWSMLVASTCLAATWPSRPLAVTGNITSAEKGLVKPVWNTVLPGTGYIVSSCQVSGDRLYVSVAHRQGAETFGALYCIDLASREIMWKFDNDQDMKQVYCSPCLAEGRIFIGEGFHSDQGCRMYGLKDQGKSVQKVWEFQTNSHTESTPFVAGGKVYFGAGDDGVYCVDARDDKKVYWQYPGKDGDTTPLADSLPAGVKMPQRRLHLHVDANPVVAGDYLFVGSGLDREKPDQTDPAILCLDVNTGKKRWLRLLPRDLPAWGGATVASEQAFARQGGSMTRKQVSGDASDEQVFFALGGGEIFEDYEGKVPQGKQAGALLCVEGKSGKELWRFAAPAGIMGKPAVDRSSVYFGCRDGNAYCLDRKDGKPRWKKEVGSPVWASPALVRCPHCGTTRLYVVGIRGQVRCFHPDTGIQLWSYELEQNTPFLSSTPAVAVTQTPVGEARRLYFGSGIGGLSFATVFCLEDR